MPHMGPSENGHTDPERFHFNSSGADMNSYFLDPPQFFQHPSKALLSGGPKQKQNGTLLVKSNVLKLEFLLHLN